MTLRTPYGYGYQAGREWAKKNPTFGPTDKSVAYTKLCDSMVEITKGKKQHEFTPEWLNGWYAGAYRLDATV